MGVFFSSVDITPTFSLIAEKSTPDSSRTIFDGLKEIPVTTFFEGLAIPVRENQIWAIKTRENKYAKILILETMAFLDSTNSAGPTPLGEATFDWIFQPNGSRQF